MGGLAEHSPLEAAVSVQGRRPVHVSGGEKRWDGDQADMQPERNSSQALNADSLVAECQTEDSWSRLHLLAPPHFFSEDSSQH